MKIKVTLKEYDKLLTKKMEEHLGFWEMLEWCSQYEIYEKETKETNKKVPRKP